MNKKLIIPIILSIIILSFIIVFLRNKENNNVQQGEIVLYYGNGCLHCAIVDEYINKNNIREKLRFKEKEVYFNKENAKDLAEKAKICGISLDYIGVPFLWDGSKCYVGDKEIIDFFSQKIK